MEDTEIEMEIIYEDEIPERTLVQIHAARSFFDPVNSATFLKLLSEDLTLASISKRKLDMQLSLAHSNPLLQSSNTCQESGKETAMKNDFWEFHSQE
tara:strand:+ start:65 stop:355 length:291 start_codon:yes stop_codon:yes gene_type:complete